jgi:hypothetical protein
MKALSFAGVVMLLLVACSSSSATSETDTCPSKCQSLKCSNGSGLASESSCETDCGKQTNGLTSACAQCVINQSQAVVLNGSGSAFCSYQLGKTTDAACQAACSGSSSTNDGG